MIVLIRRKNHQDAFNHGNFQNISNSIILRWFNWHLALRSNTVSLYKCPTNVDEIMSVYAFEIGKNIFSHTISDPRAYFLTSWYTIYTYKTWILSVCLCVHVFRSHQKSQGHEILALGLIWANLKHDEALFSKFWHSTRVSMWSSVKLLYFCRCVTFDLFQQLSAQIDEKQNNSFTMETCSIIHQLWNEVLYEGAH